MITFPLRRALPLLMLCGTTAAATLDLEQAERAAIAQDPALTALREESEAFHHQSVADGELPDPTLKLGLMNFPTDTFERDQEPMTQIQMGVQQMFPPGDTLAHKSRRTALMGTARTAAARNRALELRREVREAWLETFYWPQAAAVVKESQVIFEQLVRITHSRYAVGGQNQQDLLRAELELERLKDRETRIRGSEETARAALARWVGHALAAEPLGDTLPRLADPGPFEGMEAALRAHPAMDAENAKVEASQEAVAMAREAFKPKWMLDLTYGNRAGNNPDGSDRPDFASAMVMVDLPIFTARRQDKRLAARRHEADAVLQDRETRYRDLRRRLDATWAEWQRLGERLERYEDALLPRARANAEASLNAYQSDRGDFTMLMRARITELDTRLEALRVRVDRAKAQAGLLYLAGDQP